MKRSSSDRSSPVDSHSEPASEEFKPDITPPQSTAKRQRPPKTPKASKKTSVAKPGSPSHDGSVEHQKGKKNGDWTPEKKARLMPMVIDAGYKQISLESVAEELDVAKQQIVNHFAPSRKGGLRDKAIQAVRGDK